MSWAWNAMNKVDPEDHGKGQAVQHSTKSGSVSYEHKRKRRSSWISLRTVSPWGLVRQEAKSCRLSSHLWEEGGERSWTYLRWVVVALSLAMAKVKRCSTSLCTDDESNCFTHADGLYSQSEQNASLNQEENDSVVEVEKLSSQCQFTPGQIIQFETIYQSGYDIYTDPIYVTWLQQTHPNTIPTISSVFDYVTTLHLSEGKPDPSTPPQSWLITCRNVWQ